jgi:glycerophosphoryl diester phosphodiesterase
LTAVQLSSMYNACMKLPGVIATLFFLVPVVGATAAEAPADAARVKIVAHRGAMSERPENTMPAFIRAVELGADIVELDVRMSADGRLFLLHDRTLDRTTNGSGRASAFSFEELRELDAGGWFDPLYAGEQIPSLEEALDWAREGGVTLLLDLKETSHAFNEAVAAAVRARSDPGRIVIGAREPEQARHFRELLPECRQLAFMETPALIEAFAEAGADVLRLFLNRRGWLRDDPELAPRVRATGRQLMINGTDGNLAETRAILAFGPDWILTDNLARLKRSLELIE